MKNTENYTNEYIAKALTDKDVRASTVRVQTLRYLLEKKNHPTIDTIYNDLLDQLPGLSRTSVYNTMTTMENAGLVRRLTTDGTEMRYDADIRDHGHFKCETCGAVFDIEMDIPRPAASGKDLKGFTVNRTDLLLWGTCPKCTEAAKRKRS
jgi:Fur family peroxide stress response transcriptional regulator